MNAPVRQVHNLVQGSPEWDAFRLEHYGSSEGSAMLGISKKVKRTDLLKMKATGIAKEFSAWVQENILDHGHAVEAKARVILENLLGEDLYPATWSYGLLSASCDGLTMSGEIAFEHKQINQELFESVKNGVLPEEHQPQCQQIMHVTGAKKVIFTVSDGTAENCVRMDVFPDAEWVERLEAGWKQFHIDRLNYKPAPAVVEAVGRAPDALPALNIQVMGMVQSSNLAEFKEQAIAVFQAINTELHTDQDFADAEKTVTWCKGIEDKLELAKNQALGQTKSIEELFLAIDSIKAEARAKRLTLNELVTKRKEARRLEIQQNAKKAFEDHIETINASFGGKIKLPDIVADFGGAMKNKKSFVSMQDAVDTVLANAKIEADKLGTKITANLASLRTLAKDHAFLFADAQQLVLKDNDDLVLLINSRVKVYEDDKAKEATPAAVPAAANESTTTTDTPTAEVTASAPAVATSQSESSSPVMAGGALAPAKMKLGDINARIAPLSISAEGLATLGFNHVETDKSAKLYLASDFPFICQKLSAHLLAQVEQRMAA